MPKLDIYHHTVINALKKQDWIITHDPYILKIGRRRLYADLGAEHLISAEKDTQKIVIEIKSFIGASDVHELEQAVGQFIVYHKILAVQEPERKLFLAISRRAYDSVFSEEIGLLFLNDPDFNILVFDEDEEVITQWITH